MHYYSFNIPDWTLHTAHLTLEEEGVYFRLINYYYDTENPIPEETQSVIRRLRLGSHANLLGPILKEFFELIDGFWHHKRCNEEIEVYHSKAATARANGRKGGRPKGTKKPKITQLVNSANPEQTQSKANQELLTSNQETGKELDHLHDQLFYKFWDSGMRKVSKKKAMPLFIKILKASKASPEDFTDVLCKDIQYRLQANQLGFAQMHPTTYLNGERWKDEIIVGGESNAGIQSAGERVVAAAQRRFSQDGGDSLEALGGTG